jgi:integrase
MTAKRRRAAKGGGSVYFDASARRWVASVVTTGADGTRRRRKMTARTREDAQAHLRQMLAERDATGGQVSRRDYTVGRCLDDFLAHPPPEWRSPTTLRINAQLAGRLRARLGTVLLSKLTVGQIEEHLRREITGTPPLARRTVKDELALLRRAIRRAEKHDLASRNVAGKADLPGGALTRESGSLTMDQIERLLSSDLSPFWRAWLSVSIMCGLRPGETGALSWADVEGGVLRVRHSLQDTPGGGLVPGALKTDSSKRSIGMPAAVTEALAAWGAEQAEQQLIAGSAWEGSGLIFTDGWGRPLNRQRRHREFRAACQAAGVLRPDGQPFQLRELRHTFVTMLSNHGVPIEVISDAVGHINSSVTREVYRHQIADQVSDAARVWDRIREPGSAT